jgi:hypothetical protein
MKKQIIFNRGERTGEDVASDLRGNRAEKILGPIPNNLFLLCPKDWLSGERMVVIQPEHMC